MLITLLKFRSVFPKPDTRLAAICHPLNNNQGIADHARKPSAGYELVLGWVWSHGTSANLAVIPKQHRENKWRLIVDLSRSEGASVNGPVFVLKHALK